MKPIILAFVAAVLLAGSIFAQSDKDSTDQKVDSLRQELQAFEAQFDSVKANVATANKGLKTLSWLKISGYIQTRWELVDTLANFDKTSPDAARNNTASNIYIRRGRIKFTAQPGTSSRYVIYFDASKNTVSLKEAFVDLMKTVRKQKFTLTAGQMNYPFGYEIEYSSSKRDFPERSLAENNLFKGERDRGVNLTWDAPKYLSANVGVFQGAGIDNPTFTWWDPTERKDVIARAKVKLGLLDFGISGYWGDSFTPGSAAVAASTTWLDRNGNGQIDPGEVTNTAAKAAVPGVVKDKNRLGTDAQILFKFLRLGATTLRTEYYWAQDYDKSVPSDSLASRQGWYVWLAQSLGAKFGAAVRYDYWDPNTETASNDATGTWSFAAQYFYDTHVRITAAYDIPKRLKGNRTFTALTHEPQDNRFTMQFQFAF